MPWNKLKDNYIPVSVKIITLQREYYVKYYK